MVDWENEARLAREQQRREQQFRDNAARAREQQRLSAEETAKLRAQTLKWIREGYSYNNTTNNNDFIKRSNNVKIDRAVYNESGSYSSIDWPAIIFIVSSVLILIYAPPYITVFLIKIGIALIVIVTAIGIIKLVLENFWSILLITIAVTFTTTIKVDQRSALIAGPCHSICSTLTCIVIQRRKKNGYSMITAMPAVTFSAWVTGH
jgi:hypothetical protein